MKVKHLTMDCPECYEEMENTTLCLNIDNNRFDIFEVDGSIFNCESCGAETVIMIHKETFKEGE